MSSERASHDAPWALTAIVFLLGLLLIWQFTRWTVWTVELRSETAGLLKWYVDSGDGFSEREGAYTRVPAGEWAEIEVRLPAGVPRKVRLDPIDSEGSLDIRRVKWDEPRPWGGGEMDPAQAQWFGAAVAEWTPMETWRLEPAQGVPDIYGVWQQTGGWPLEVWWTVRVAIAAFFGWVTFFVGSAWNRRIKKRL